MTILTHRPGSGIIFVTGTDTGVGKTLLTGLLLHHLCKGGIHALATKPYSCGRPSDVELFHELQDHELTRDEISPFTFGEPVAPLVAARILRRTMALTQVVGRVRRLQSRCECLLVEGVGGLLVPLGEGFSILDLIAALDCCVVVVARNRVGTINHCLLTVNALRRAGITRVKIVLMSAEEPDASALTNEIMLSELLSPCCVFSIPFLGADAATVAGVNNNWRKIKKTLARVADFGSFSPLFSKAAKTVSKKSR